MRNNREHPVNLFACFVDELTPSDERLLRALLADEDRPDARVDLPVADPARGRRLARPDQTPPPDLLR